MVEVMAAVNSYIFCHRTTLICLIDSLIDFCVQKYRLQNLASRLATTFLMTVSMWLTRNLLSVRVT